MEVRPSGEETSDMSLKEDGRVPIKALTTLIRLLTDHPLTARQIAAKTGVTKVTAYRRVLSLKERGVYIVEHKVRDGATGPESVAYMVIR